MQNRTMRLIVLFDLPVETKKQRKDYTDFRKFLIENGFLMMQYSVYVRITRNWDDLNKFIKRVENNLPPEGEVRCLPVTNKQFASMRLLKGKKKEIDNSADDLIEL